MTDREPPDAPPQLLGFAFYLLATGAVALGVGRLGEVAENLHAVAVAPLPSWALLVGQGMVLVGLLVAWRATIGAVRRLLAVAAVLWLTLLVLELQQGRVPDQLLAHAPRAAFASTTASLVGRAIVLLVVAAVAHATGRAFASRTWPTTLGATLVFADAWAEAWPVLTRASSHAGVVRLLHVTPAMAAGGVGLLLAAGGLYGEGRAILGGVPSANRAPLDRALPLFADAVTALAGLALAHAASLALATPAGLSMRDVADTTTLGGELVAFTVVVVASRAMRPHARASGGFALAALAALVVEVILRYVLWSRGLFASGPAPFPPDVVTLVAGIRVLLEVRALRSLAGAAGAAGSAAVTRRLRLAANLLGGSLVASLFAPELIGGASGGGIVLAVVKAIAILLGAAALYATVAAATDVRRIEIQLGS